MGKTVGPFLVPTIFLFLSDTKHDYGAVLFMPCDIMAPEWPCTTVVFRKLSVSNRRILRSSCECQASSQMRRGALFFLAGKAPSLDRGVFAGCQAPSNSRRTKEIRPQSSGSPHSRLCCLKQVVRSGGRSGPDPRNKGPGAGTAVGGAESVSRVAGDATTRPGTAEVGGGQTLGHTGPPLPQGRGRSLHRSAQKQEKEIKQL